MGISEAREASVEITQSHVDRIERIARQLARTTALGSLCGEDELVSESMVALWDLAQRYEPDTKVPFPAWIQLQGRHRLIDYLRHVYGRADANGEMHIRTRVALSMRSLDDHHDQDPDDERENSGLVDRSPGVEETVEARDELRRLGEILRSGQLTEAQVRCLMWPVVEGTPAVYMAESGKSKPNVSSTRSHAKDKAAELLGRSYERRPYTQWRNPELKPNLRRAEDTERDPINDAEASQATPGLGRELLDRTEPGTRKLLDLERRPGPRRIRPDELRLQARPPSGVRGAGPPDPSSDGTRPHLLRPKLREPGTPRTSDRRGEPPQEERPPGSYWQVRQRPQPRRDTTLVLAPSESQTLVVHGLRPRATGEIPGSSTTAHANRVTTMDRTMSKIDGRRKHNHSLRYITDEQLLNDREHMTLQEIADKYGCVLSTVSHRLRKIGVAGTRPRYADLIPWRVTIEHSGGYIIETLRHLGQYRAGRLHPQHRAPLARWIAERVNDNTVATYDRDTGFSYTPAATTRPEDHPYYEAALIDAATSEMSA